MRQLARFLLLAPLVAFCAAPLGCHQRPQAKLQNESVSLGESLDESLLTLGTARLLAETYVNMVTVTGEAARVTEETSVREGSIRWRIMTAGRLDRIRALPDPRLRYAALWTLAVQMRIAFTEGEDSTRFGDQQYRYQDFARACEKNVVELGYRVFPDAVIEQVAPEIEKVAKTGGVAGWFAPEAAAPQRGALTELLSVPLSPISGMQGVGDTPAAINRFTDTARDMTRVVENLPERTRWQIELMLLEAEQQGAVAAAIREMAETRKAVEHATTQFPEQMRLLLADPALAEQLERIQRAIESAGGTSRQFSETIREFRQAVADVRQTLLETQQSSVAVQRAAAELRLTTETIREDESATRPAKPEKDKFRVTDVGPAAERVESAAAEVRKVIADLRAQGEIPALDMGTRQAERLVTMITWSGVILILVAFLAGVGLIIFWRLINRRQRS